MTSERWILHLVCGDAGSAIDLVPSIRKLQEQEVEIHCHVDPSPLAREIARLL